MGAVAKYLSFTGQSGCYAGLPLAVLADASTFTIEAKLSTTSTKNSSNNWEWGTIAGREINGNWKNDFGFCVNNGKLCFWAEPASNGSSSTRNTISDAVVNDGAIHKVAVVSSNGAIDLYCDGVNVAHTDNVNAKVSANQTILIAYDSNSKSYLQMNLCELRFWSIARTQEEIFADIDGTETGLQGWYLPSNDGLKDYSGNERHATLYGNPAYVELSTLPVTLTVDVQRVIKNDRQFLSTIKGWLPFDESATQDLCENEWTAIGSPTISETNAINGNALQLDGASCLENDSIAAEIGEDIWTIHWYATCTGTQAEQYFFGTYNANYGTSGTGNNRWVCVYYNLGNPKLALYGNDTTAGVSLTSGKRYHYMLSYDGTALRFFIDGKLKITKTANIKLGGVFRIGCCVGRDRAQDYFTGSIDEFQILQGVAWTGNFTPPTAEDYQDLAFVIDRNIIFTVDVERKISNRVEVTFDVERKFTWRYVNLGTADTLTISGTTLTNLPESQSKTGSAFYQTTIAKCFDLPATDEVWIKFDIYFDGTNRWRASNGGANGNSALAAQKDGNLSLFANNAFLQNTADMCKQNQLQTVLLHMVSGSTDGVIEAWVDGEKIYTYTGDVNHGDDFADIFLQSDGAGTFFSNVIISSAKVGLADGYHKISFDTERRIRNVIEFVADVERITFCPRSVPLIGEHFNHFVPSMYVFRDAPLIIILPKKSPVFIRGEGSIKVFSDTDAESVKVGGFYTQLDECETVFIMAADSPRRVIKDFMLSLDQSTLSDANAALDAAINFCTGGLIPNKDILVDNFLRDLHAADSYTDFLRDFCDIVLYNDDTGAITGSDASGSSIKTAESIVPEPLPVEEWVVPAAGSSTSIRGLTIQFPSAGANGSSFSNTEKHILAGLYSVWIEQALILIEKSFGLNFTEAGSSLENVTIRFKNESSNSLAYTSYQDSALGIKNVILTINMKFYDDINLSSADGESSTSGLMFFDRNIAHEFTHAVMLSNINKFDQLPLYLQEGAAELVHGADDTRLNSFIYLTQTNTNKLEEIFSTGGTSSDGDYPYAAGYMLLRYLAKQGQSDSLAPTSIEITNLLISDGATDSSYNSLTDYTRHVFSTDVLRSLFKSTEIIFDVEILHVVFVEFLADVKRSLLAHLFLYPRNSSDFFDDPNNPFVVRTSSNHLLTSSPLPDNTEGLQSLQVSLAEQQITDQLSFTAVIPFDIMQQVEGQFLDYNFSMRVEKVIQQGILFSCECCSDLDQLLFTQIAYKIPPTTFYYKVDGETINETKTVAVETHYPFASAHVDKIAAALGLSAVKQFDDFLSTVLMDDLGGVTYNDLIRDVFGWSARVPTQLINVFIRDGKLFVVQRGHESHSIDISNADMTLPTFTRELVRTSWGSTPWSKTNTHEMDIPFFVPADKVIDDSGDDNPDDDDEENVREVSTDFHGLDYRGHTTYTYNDKGLLVKTYTYMEKGRSVSLQSTYTTVEHEYDDDGTMIYTSSFTQSFGYEGRSASKSIEQKGYVILPNGEKFLSWEQSDTYQNDDGLSISDKDLVDSKVTTHSPSRVGQSHTITVSSDGDVVGAVVGQNTGDDRVTPFRSGKAQQLQQDFDSHSFDSDTGTWQSKKAEWGTTVNGLSLFDSSFPIHNKDKLIQVTNALRDLNRKTKETVNLTIYDFDHLIDFNDRIILNGNEYFLASNTARSSSRIRSEQTLSLVRWF